ncbi:MAG: hypothetical protein KDD42_09010 [Bdellovibrionales bacterium]|nr:hypothetical protein [Bdellovibrionales bacterium]
MKALRTYLFGCGIVFNIALFVILLYPSSLHHASLLEIRSADLPNQNQTLVDILVAGEDIHSGANFADVLIKKTPWPSKQIPDDSLADSRDLLGKCAAFDIPRNVPVLKRLVRECSPNR